MTKSSFVYVTYIKSTAERVWEALTTAEFTRQYWFGMHLESDWKAGSPWRIANPERGTSMDTGTVLESDPPRRLVLRWRNEWNPEFKAEGDAVCTLTLEPHDGAVKLTVLHEMDRAESKLIQAVGGGWPRILSNLKTLLETGQPAFTQKSGQ